MVNRERVIKGLLCCSHTDGTNLCLLPYDNRVKDCTALMSMDALALPKEQDSCENCAIAIEDRQPVVRCKYCTYLNADTGICIVGIPHGYKDTFYCAYGKRR